MKERVIFYRALKGIVVKADGGGPNDGEVRVSVCGDVVLLGVGEKIGRSHVRSFVRLTPEYAKKLGEALIQGSSDAIGGEDDLGGNGVGTCDPTTP